MLKKIWKNEQNSNHQELELEIEENLMFTRRNHDTLTLILAGGEGRRLYPLTKERAKPAVVFGGIYRIIDFALSNCINSGLRKIYLLTQYRSHSLQRHITKGWHLPRPGEFLDIVPPQFRGSDTWYRGTADAIFHNIFLLESEKPENVLILAGDHIYKMDYAKFINHHRETGADLTIGCVPSPRKKAMAYGCVATNENGDITGFVEKPENPPAIPGREDHSFVSMGIYVWKTEALVKAVIEDAKKESTNHDFGKNVIPSMLEKGKKIQAYSFIDPERNVEAYWRDIGDLDSYFESNMDLCNVDPVFNLYDKDWPIHTYSEPLPPAKMVFADEESKTKRAGKALDSLVGNGSIISGSRVEHSVISPRVRIHSYSEITNCIIMHETEIGRNCRIKNAIIDKKVSIPENTVIGYDLEKDRKQFKVSSGGVVVVPKGHIF
jgi:glucose-1-phosphate adenylyltransferase